MLNKKQKSFVKRIHLVTDDGFNDRKAFYTVKIVFYSSSMNDGKFISYRYPVIIFMELTYLIMNFYTQPMLITQLSF